MKTQVKPKVAIKSTKVVVKPSAKIPVKKVQVKTTNVVVRPKAQEPTYKNLRMGVNIENREATGENRNNIKPNKQDSMAYKAGYNIGLTGSKGSVNERPIVKMGRWEGQNARPKVAPKKK
jgi:hypothetical protein